MYGLGERKRKEYYLAFGRRRTIKRRLWKMKQKSRRGLWRVFGFYAQGARKLKMVTRVFQ